MVVSIVTSYLTSDLPRNSMCIQPKPDVPPTFLTSENVLVN